MRENLPPFTWHSARPQSLASTLSFIMLRSRRSAQAKAAASDPDINICPGRAGTVEISQDRCRRGPTHEATILHFDAQNRASERRSRERLITSLLIYSFAGLCSERTAKSVITPRATEQRTGQVLPPPSPRPPAMTGSDRTCRPFESRANARSEQRCRNNSGMRSRGRKNKSLNRLTPTTMVKAHGRIGVSRSQNSGNEQDAEDSAAI